MIVIDGASYKIDIIELNRKAEFLDKYAERTEDGVLNRELIGVYFNYELSLANSQRTGYQVYDSLWNKLTEPIEFHDVSMPNSSFGNVTFRMYVNNVSDTVYKVKDGKNYFKGLTVNFYAKIPTRR